MFQSNYFRTQRTKEYIQFIENNGYEVINLEMCTEALLKKILSKNKNKIERILIILKK